MRRAVLLTSGRPQTARDIFKALTLLDLSVHLAQRGTPPALTAFFPWPHDEGLCPPYPATSSLTVISQTQPGAFCSSLRCPSLCFATTSF